MADLFNYLEWRGDITLDQVPFNKVDALLFALVSYNIFDNLVPSDFKTQLSMNEVLERFRQAPDLEERKDIGAMINERTYDVFEQAAISLRFCGLTVCGYRSIIDLEKVEQFAAITFIYKNINYIVYRGTDDTVVGWKEDFNISYLSQIPSQSDAIKYFEEAASVLKGKFVLIGHSKGGNLVINTAVSCKSKLQKKIHQLYNFDGPGFSKEFYIKKEYLNIQDRLYSFYPGFSIVGMIFNHPQNFEIVHCDGFAINQHDPLTWQIKGGDFEHEKDFTPESKFFYRTFNDWVSIIDSEKREKLVNALFGIIEASEYKTNKELVKNRLKASARMIDAFAKQDKQTKNEIHKMVRILHQTVKDSIPMLSLINVNK